MQLVFIASQISGQRWCYIFILLVLLFVIFTTSKIIVISISAMIIDADDA